MALETLNIDYIRDKDNKMVFPVTHSDAIIGGLSKKGYNINDTVYNNNWDNVINTGIYYSSASASSTNRPQLLSGTSNINVVYDFIEVIRIGSSAFQLAKITDGFNAEHIVAYREFTSVTDTGAGSKGSWKSSYCTPSITGNVTLTNVTAVDQTINMLGINSYSDLDGRILIVYQESNASAKLPTRIKVNNLAYVPLYNLDGTAVEQDTFENKRVPILISYSSADSCFYLVGGGSGGAGHKILKSNKTVMPKEKNLMITGVSVHDANITDVPADKLTKIKITAPDSSDESIKNIRKMTQAQYDALTTKDANTVYYITDGNDPIDMSDYIPLTGTEPITTISASTGETDGKPVTGMIQIANNVGGISGLTGNNDSYRIIGRNDNSIATNNAGYLEIATGDDGGEPIYIRQYNLGANNGITNNKMITSDFLNGDTTKNALIRTATILDTNGDTLFPQRLTISEENNTRIVMGSGCKDSAGNIDQFSWIDHRKSDDTVVASLGLLNTGEVFSLKGKFAYGTSDTSKKGNAVLDSANKTRTLVPRAVSQWNEDEECIEFVFA